MVMFWNYWGLATATLSPTPTPPTSNNPAPLSLHAHTHQYLRYWIIDKKGPFHQACITKISSKSMTGIKPGIKLTCMKLLPRMVIVPTNPGHSAHLSLSILILIRSNKIWRPPYPLVNVDQPKQEKSSSFLVTIQNLTTLKLGEGTFYNS